MNDVNLQLFNVVPTSKTRLARKEEKPMPSVNTQSTRRLLKLRQFFFVSVPNRIILVPNQKENCQYNLIPVNLKENPILVFWV